MSQLSLSLLGPVRVTLGGQPVTGFDYAKVGALLFYLAVEHHHPHQRDALAELLWPDQPAHVARSSLRQALATLRKAIHDHEASPPFLLITRETLQFNTASNYTLDSETFTTCVGRHGSADDIEQLKAAVRLYRGAFLDGAVPRDSAEFEEWVLLKREWFERQALDALVRIADYYEAHDDTDEALIYARQQLALDPWRELAHRQVMRLLARSGDRSAALAQYEHCRAVLQADLSIEPEDETTALYEQIRARGLAVSNPTQTVSARKQYRLPPQPTSFVGRETELAEIGELLQQPACRLITLLGPGGIGKTRLALQVAESHGMLFADGVCWVPLAALPAPEYLPDAIARALGCPLEGADDPRERLLGWLADKRLLLILDNFEHLMAGAHMLVELLTHALRLTLMVTTRERLHLQWEWLFDVEGLPYPQDVECEHVMESGALQLFMARAQQIRRRANLTIDEQRAVMQICRLVEGMPLALEMAAAASREQPYVMIARSISASLDALQASWRDRPERHRSMRATFASSWQLLCSEDQRALAGLSVFRGGFEIAAAEDVAGASLDLLVQLVEKSLLRRSDQERYEIHDLIRQFAGEKLRDSGSEMQLHEAHLHWFVALAEAAEPQLNGAEQQVWMERLERDGANIRVALQWAFSHHDELAARLCGAIWRFWWIRGHISEGRRWLDQALTANLPPALRARVLSGAGAMASFQQDIARAYTCFMEATALHRALGNQPEIARNLDNTGVMLNRMGKHAEARALFEESLAIDQALEDPRGIAFAFGNLADTAYYAGNYAEAEHFYQRSLALHRELGDQHSIAISLTNLGEVARLRNDYHHARRYLDESIALAREMNATYTLAIALCDSGHVLRAQADDSQAHAMYAEALPMLIELGETRVAAEAMIALAALAVAHEQPERAVRLLSAARRLLDSTDARLESAHQAEYEQTLAATRAGFEGAAWAAAWAAGQAMTLEQAMKYAVADTNYAVAGDSAC
ncbi:MAG TPA: tetratricopeptide repeat protein [Roseiflexaceae bacterium]|nr:tetratricopeptide repeat protein [Roseiflexaceae bacterium]